MDVDPIAEDAVVLLEGSPLARVRLGGSVHDAVRIVIAGPIERDIEVLSRAAGDVILLKEGATTAPVRVGERVRLSLPLYKEKREEGRVREVRVRVARIVPRRPPGAFARLFHRGR